MTAQFDNNKERLVQSASTDHHAEREISKHVTVSQHASKLVVSIVKKGQGKAICTHMREHGAFGTTVLRAHGTAQQAMLDFLGLENTDREMVLCFLPLDQADSAVDQVSVAMGMQRQGEGIIFSIPMDCFAGQAALMKLTRMVSKKQQEKAASEKGEKK